MAQKTHAVEEHRESAEAKGNETTNETASSEFAPLQRQFMAGDDGLNPNQRALLQRQRLVGNQAVLRSMANSRASLDRITEPLTGSVQLETKEQRIARSAPELFVSPQQPAINSTQGIHSAKNAEYIQRFPSWSGMKEAGYKTLINGAVAFRHQIISILRAQAARLPPGVREPAVEFVEQINDILQILFDFIFYLIGVVVGSGEGVFDLVLGIANLTMAVLQYVFQMAQAMLGDPENLKAHWAETKQALRNIIPGLKALFEKWKNDFSNAPQERQSAMIGELVGQIIAVLATAELGGAKVGATGTAERGFGTAERATGLGPRAEAATLESGTDKSLKVWDHVAKLKATAIENWSKGGQNRLVKVFARGDGPKIMQSGSIRGFVTQERSIAGQPLSEIEHRLGLKAGTLKNGADVIWIDEVPKPEQFEFVVPQGRPPGTPGGYSNVPGSPDFPPGSGVPQWILKGVRPAGIQSIEPGGKYIPK
jgi:hypothetical protein